MIPVVVFSVGLLMLVVERLRPGVRLAAVPGWWLRTLLLHGVQGAMDRAWRVSGYYIR